MSIEQQIQIALNAKGFGPVATDGVVGQRTLAAIKAFQQSIGLMPDGIAGPRTQAALFDVARADTPAAQPSAAPSPVRVTVQALCAIAGVAPTALMPAIVNAVNKYAPQYNVVGNDLRRFLANVAVETGGFRTLEENLNYSAQRLVQVWPKRFPSIAAAQQYDHNPQALANFVYGQRLGNKGKANAGWLYRGSGALQTTGYDNFAEVERVTGMPVTSNPDLLRAPDSGVQAAFIFWDKNRLNGIADIQVLRERINGGDNGLREVSAAYQRALRVAV